MAKVAFSMLLLLQIICATYTAAGSNELKAACKRTSDVKFCMDLLQPYASEFEDNDPDKMGYAAISASLARAQAARAFMVRESSDTELNAAEIAAVKDCLGKVGDSVDSLRKAAQEFDKMRGAKDDELRERHRKNVIKKIKSSSDDQKSCYDLLEKDRKLTGDEIVEAVRQQAAEAAHANFMAHAFIQ